MANKMLIDATHPEETRVVVVRGNRVEEFDFESANRKQLRGNIYLAKVTRVEPSLQAAFIEYGGNRHGFLAFSEIHPDYYQIPVADRQALIDEEERAHRDAEAEADRRAGGGGGGSGGGGGGGGGGRSQHRRRHRHAAAGRSHDRVQSEPVEGDLAAHEPNQHDDANGEAMHHEGVEAFGGDMAAEHGSRSHDAADATANEPAHTDTPAEITEIATPPIAAAPQDAEAPAAHETSEGAAAEHAEGASSHETAGHHHAETDGDASGHDDDAHEGGDGEEEEIVESVGGADVMEEVPDRMPRLRRQYKIQEVIKRRQIMLVQVVKEERGTKGAALTTYLSLAGRYSVLMPNTARGGGISRKITSFQDRRRLKEVAQELEVPEGMGVILRTAGATRTKPEIKRDFEYLLRMWETVRDVTLNSTAPTLVYEEGSLVKRSIRDLYNKDIEEILVAGDQAYKEAKGFMRMLMPSHAKNVKPYRESQPLLTRFGIESQLDAMFSPVVQLRSGGYIVINQAEALVAIDVNSGRATREHHIEDTALKTNLEAAEEVSRQLRLRDLAGLIVIDFIDMDEKRNNRSVERRLKECLKHDRARIQVGRISHFGLLEMSRQRIRTSVLESSTDKCPHCGGTGHVRSVASVALQVLRMIEETLLRSGTHDLVVRTRSDIAIYVLNHKRSHLRDLEERFSITITINADATMGGQTPFMLERGEQVHSVEQARAIAAAQPVPAPISEPEDEADFAAADEAEEAEELAAEDSAATNEDETDEDAADEVSDEIGGGAGADTNDEAGEAGDGHRRRRRRRRGRRGDGRETREGAPSPQQDAAPEHTAPDENGEAEDGEFEAGEHEPRAGGEPREQGDVDGEPRRRRRRGRRGGRRNRRDREGGDEHHAGEMTHEAGGDTPIEPELAGAVADFGGPPVSQPSSYEPRTPAAAPEFAPPPRAAEPPAATHQAETPAQEASRRRSTVREPVSFASDDGPTSHGTGTPAPQAPARPAAAEPQAPSPEQPQDDAGKPRRTGWWGKRMLGG